MSQRIVKILQPRVPIAIVRLDDLDDAIELSGALLAGGITTLEFTLTNKKANQAITKVQQIFGDRLIVGAGTVLDADHAAVSIDAGAQFLVTPILAPDVIEEARSVMFQLYAVHSRQPRSGLPGNGVRTWSRSFLPVNLVPAILKIF